jgi:PAS domain S-box-containing protein
MISPPDQPAGAADLRQLAEAQSRLVAEPSADQLEKMSPAEIQRTLHELRVHQIELEMQNEELRRAQLELGEARTRYFDLFDLAPVGYCTLSVAGLISEANLTAATLLGVTRAMLVTRPISRFMDRTDQEIYYRHRRQLMATGAPQAFELRLTKADGTSFWAHLGTTVANEPDGTPVHRVVISDVSSRKTAEMEMLDAKLRLDALFQGARDAIILADPVSGTILDVNHQTEALLGRTRQELIGMHQSLLHPAELRETLHSAFVRHAAGDGSHVETSVLHQLGGYIQVEITSIVIALPDGRRLVMGLFRDIRERVRLHELLHQSEKMVAIGELAGGIAHDFNNQLAGISGYAELLTSTLADKHQQKWAKGIQGAALRSAELTRQLLAFARKGQSQRTPTDLRPIISDVIELLHPGLDRRITITQHHSDSLCQILGDPSQLHHVLLNLALNARDAMPGGGKMSFSTRIVHLDAQSGLGIVAGRFLEILIRDSGCGMDAETKRRIFEPFFTTKGPGKGTGLGLAAVYGVVKNHAGQIDVISTPGQGSTFILHFPLCEDATQRPPTEQLPALIPVLAPVARRILVVDDEEVARNITGELLCNLGHVATTCAGANEALALCQPDCPFDLVILDMIMPRIGGREAFIALRAAHPALCVLIVSGHSLNGEVQTILDLGARGFLQKPFSRSALAKAVHEALMSNPGSPAKRG